MHEPTAPPAPTQSADPIAVLGSALRILPPAVRMIFQGGADARNAAAQHWQPGFSSVACRATTAGDAASLWLGPDEFLLLSPQPISLAPALGAIPHSLVDVSDRQIGFELSGPDCVAWLSGGCPLDLHPDVFPVGMCTRTLFAKSDIVLWRTAADVFHVEVWRSFLDYTTQLLAEIAVS